MKEKSAFSGINESIATQLARVHTVSDVFEVLVEIRDELRQLNEPQVVTAVASETPKIDPGATIAVEEVWGRGPCDVRLSDAITQYLGQKTYEVSAQHLEVTRLTLRAFEREYTEAWGNPSTIVRAVSRHSLLAYRQQLLDKDRTNKTVNNHLAIIQAFFGWVQENGWRSDNPAKGLKLRNKGRASRKRKAFSDEQIEEVFKGLGGCLGAEWVMDSSARTWLPLIMLYTGARPEEVAQLRVGDVRNIASVAEWPVKCTWVFDFATLDDGQRRKNEASRRLVPVHPRLWELGLGALVGPSVETIEGEQIQNDNDQLFPELNPGANGRLAEAPSRWFNRTWLRDRKGISDPKLVLYSLRHSVATALKHKGVPESLLSQLLGHSVSSQSTGRYGKEYPVEQLAEVVAKLDWRV